MEGRLAEGRERRVGASASPPRHESVHPLTWNELRGMRGGSGPVKMPTGARVALPGLHIHFARAADGTFSASLKRAAAVGATGVTVYALSKALRRWLHRTKPDES